jgi:hypothetical protein
LDFIPFLSELGVVEAKLTLGQFFDFRFGVNAGGLFNLPTLSKRSASCAILVFGLLVLTSEVTATSRYQLLN